MYEAVVAPAAWFKTSVFADACGAHFPWGEARAMLRSPGSFNTTKAILAGGI
jgi:hypothetical protein